MKLSRLTSGARTSPARFRQRAPLLMAGALGLVLGAMLQGLRPVHPETPPSEPGAHGPDTEVGRRDPPACPPPQRRTTATPSAPKSEDEEREASYRTQQSREIVDLLSERFRAVSAAFPQGQPEFVADHLRLYQVGLVDGILRTAPELTGPLGKHVESALCDPQAGDAMHMVMARLAGDTPELASPRGFDCIFQRRGKEDVVLWTALDAWRRSGLARTDGLEKLERSASDARTKQRLHPESLRFAPAPDDTAIALRPETETNTN